MSETDTDPADQFDARVSAQPLDERAPGLWARYRRRPDAAWALFLIYGIYLRSGPRQS